MSMSTGHPPPVSKRSTLCRSARMTKLMLPIDDEVSAGQLDASQVLSSQTMDDEHVLPPRTPSDVGQEEEMFEDGGPDKNVPEVMLEEDSDGEEGRKEREKQRDAVRRQSQHLRYAFSVDTGVSGHPEANVQQKPGTAFGPHGRPG